MNGDSRVVGGVAAGVWEWNHATRAHDRLHLHGAAALALVFLLPALESSAFIGFLFPGEIAVLLGGVLASYGRFPLAMAIVAAVAGAFVGDSVGYAIGRRYGRGSMR